MLALSLGGCGSNDELAFEFLARFDAGGASLVVDDVPNPSELSYVFDSYDVAQAHLVLDVSIETAQGSGTTELRPGTCAAMLAAMNIDVGRMVQEEIIYGVVDGPTPTLGEIGYRCRGTKLQIWSGS